jgi:flagellar operon protein
MSSGPILYPSVTSLPGQSGVNPADRLSRKQEGVAKGEFDQILAKQSESPEKGRDLTQVKSPLKFSAHASQRLSDRKITLDAATMTKVNNAIDMAEAKGIDDTLVLTKDAALIVNVKNRTVITAMDRNAMTGNVFTNIDGAVIV